jgi:phosphohistidine swiveling domain-containing protein
MIKNNNLTIKYYFSNDVVIRGNLSFFTGNDKIYNNKIVLLDFLNVNHISFLVKSKLIIVRKSSLLSHALIVAKEFNLPLIIGADELFILKENDLVELNLNEKYYKIMNE